MEWQWEQVPWCKLSFIFLIASIIMDDLQILSNYLKKNTKNYEAQLHCEGNLLFPPISRSCCNDLLKSSNFLVFINCLDENGKNNHGGGRIADVCAECTWKLLKDRNRAWKVTGRQKHSFAITPNKVELPKKEKSLFSLNSSHWQRGAREAKTENQAQGVGLSHQTIQGSRQPVSKLRTRRL